MSKREFRKYIGQMDAEALRDQLLEVYEKFPPVKEFYDFAFNPNEEKRLEEAKLKVKAEYFPQRGKRAKLRRGTATKYIRKFQLLGMDPGLLTDFMLYTIEVAQQFSGRREVRYATFFTGMLRAFTQTLEFVKAQGLEREFAERLHEVAELAQTQRWMNATAFRSALAAFVS